MSRCSELDIMSAGGVWYSCRGSSKSWIAPSCTRVAGVEMEEYGVEWVDILIRNRNVWQCWTNSQKRGRRRSDDPATVLTLISSTLASTRIAKIRGIDS